MCLCNERNCIPLCISNVSTGSFTKNSRCTNSIYSLPWESASSIETSAVSLMLLSQWQWFPETDKPKNWTCQSFERELSSVPSKWKLSKFSTQMKIVYHLNENFIAILYAMHIKVYVAKNTLVPKWKLYSYHTNEVVRKRISMHNFDTDLPHSNVMITLRKC